MFYELIYTRCRQGIDITQKGRKISSDGYKVYSCSPSVMEEGKVDLPFLVNSAQAKQSCTDPGFMDDAYLYYVPDTGAGFFINFHPIPFDAKAKGDYSHRPGNFLNHALIGDFSQVYPYKMFQDEGIWDAKTKGEAYYYENPPGEEGPPNSGGIDDPPGHYQFDDIRAFISDGRQEALKKAVAFLIAQYQEEPEKRKYLVIRDESSRNIELWIAAIESAFPPRLASIIPFATRMDKFTNTNRYTVKNGIYQPQMNLQDPNQKQRFRAMILGVDERDKTNVNASRPLANSPFVLLDGKQKQAMFEVKTDISKPYYQLIVKFDGEHQKFCGEFLQTFSKLRINAEIYDFYEMFTVLNKSSSDTRTLANTLGRLNKYEASGTGIIKEIYNRVNQDVSRFLAEDFSCALNIINWLLATSKNAGDAGAMLRLTPIVCDGFASVIFGKNDNTLKRSLWTQIKSTGFKMDAVRVITDMERIKNNLPNLRTPADAAAFMAIYLDAASLIGADKQNVDVIVKFGIKICSDNNDTMSLQEIVSSLSQIKTINSQDLLFAIVKSADTDKKLGEFVLKYIIDNDASMVLSNESVRSFCKKLKDQGLESLAGLALMKRVNILNKPDDMVNFIKTILLEMNFIGEEALANVFEAVDNKVNFSDDKLVELLQTKRPSSAKCKDSAHFYALHILETNNRKKQNLIEEFTKLKNQGFPAIITDVTEEKYISKLVESLIKADMTEEEQLLIIDILLKAPKEYSSVFLDKLIDTAAKQRDKWNALFKYVSDGKNKQIDDIVIQALADSRKSEKSLAELGLLLTDEKVRKYYDDDIGCKALEKIAARKKPGLFGKIFG